MKIFKRILNLYSLKYPQAIVYMAQSNEYRVLPFLVWFWELPNFRHVQIRSRLDKTSVAKLLLGFLAVGMFLQYVAALACIASGLSSSNYELMSFGVAALITAPVIWVYLLCLPLILGRTFVIGPAERKTMAAAREIFANHNGKVIAVLGSYGKTTMKELLRTVLSDDLKVAATPANLNTLGSVARFANKLDADEDVVIVEYGEEKPGDIALFADMTKPDYAVITGAAPAHLSHYKNIDSVLSDLLSIADFVEPENIYVNKESQAFSGADIKAFVGYDRHGLGGWKVANLKIDYDSTSFELSHKSKKLKVKSGLLGAHQVGPLSAAVALAQELGLSGPQIEKSIKKSHSFEHRMQPKVINGAWMIDDTYNGNLEGIKAGIDLLTSLPAKRKIYVTPGLVEQGDQAEKVHKQIGKMLGRANPDIVVLMQNSVTEFIKSGLESTDFSGQLRIEQDPLKFYANINHMLAAGDLLMMQNDWPDNYR